ncbi:hypothetical protein [Shimazuella alba]|uniref:Uncharacterized protein n=1 Tax=Shimazuella alba TaxID=2690964 RepID=A0A6I4VWQ7_9BACL|nr:hypothetical protein [Shimazuella alba]MXQ52442.1 hypothetical protein [Shimazuella alba]
MFKKQSALENRMYILHLPQGETKEGYIQRTLKEAKNLKNQKLRKALEDEMSVIQNSRTKICDGSCGYPHSGTHEYTLF